jgi:hypothetical protein
LKKAQEVMKGMPTAGTSAQVAALPGYLKRNQLLRQQTELDYGSELLTSRQKIGRQLYE